MTGPGEFPMRLQCVALTLAFLSAACLGHPASAAERRIDVAVGVSLRVIDEGAQSSLPSLVLIPGWTMGADVWEGQIGAFSKDRRVVAVDPRSQGDSTKTVAGNTPEVRARDYHEMIGKLGLGRVVLVAWSQAVQDVAAYVDAFGTANLAGVVLVDAPVSEGARALAEHSRQAAERFHLLSIYTANQEAYLRGMMDAIVERPLGDAELEALVQTSMKTPPSLGVSMFVADLYGPDRTDALAKFDVPTLVIAASSSPELAAQEAMAENLPRGRLEVVPGAAHAVFLDKPERFSELVQSFLEGLR
jgi:microsomal epoxide hydrolase